LKEKNNLTNEHNRKIEVQNALKRRVSKEIFARVKTKVYRFRKWGRKVRMKN
jgi:hypothetical protein